MSVFESKVRKNKQGKNVLKVNEKLDKFVISELAEIILRLQTENKKLINTNAELTTENKLLVSKNEKLEESKCDLSDYKTKIFQKIKIVLDEDAEKINTLYEIVKQQNDLLRNVEQIPESIFETL